MAVVIKNSALLDAYYDQRTLSSLPNGNSAFFQFGQLDWGYDLIEIIDGTPSVMPIPLGKASIQNVFHTGDANYTYINGNIVITATLPAGVVPEGQSKQFSCVGIKDTRSNLIAIAVVQPVWVYSDRGLSIEITIETARTDKIGVSQ